MEDRPLVTQFRLSFARIVIASILATVVTYILAAVLYSRATFRVIYPANYYEQQIPELDAYIREKNTALLSRSGEKGLQSVIHGDGMSYQVLTKMAAGYMVRIMKTSSKTSRNFSAGSTQHSDMGAGIPMSFPLLIPMEKSRGRSLSPIV